MADREVHPQPMPGEPQKQLIIVRDHGGALYGLLAAILTVTLICGGLFGYLAIRNTKINEKQGKQLAVEQKKIRALTDELDRREREDSRIAREAAARLCGRENMTRGGIHWVLSLGEQSRRLLPLIEFNVPILDCGPNLEGMGAKPLTKMQQRRFVELWARRKLDPTPSAKDVIEGPDENPERKRSPKRPADDEVPPRGKLP